MTPVVDIESVEMKEDPVVGRYVDLTVALGERAGDIVVLDQHGYVVLGKRRLDRAVKAGVLVVPTVRIDAEEVEARLLRLADFAEHDGLVLMTLERILAGGAESGSAA